MSAAGGLIPAGMDRGSCRRCGRSIFWARILDPVTLKVKRHADGKPKRVPLERVPSEAGTWLLVTEPRTGMRWIGGGELVPAAERWVGHHRVCTRAASERRPRPRPVPPRAATVTPIRDDVVVGSSQMVLGGGGDV